MPINPNPTPTPVGDLQGTFEDMTGWTWQELEDYASEIAGAAGGGSAGAAGESGVPPEGSLMPNGARVLCSNPSTGVYIVELPPLPPPPHPFERDLEGAAALATPQPRSSDSADSSSPSLEEEDDVEDAEAEVIDALTC